MEKTIAMKMGIKENSKAYIMNADKEAIEAIQLPHLDLATELDRTFEYIHFFVKSQKDFNENFPRLKSHLKHAGMLWVSWPKSGKLNTDLNLKTVINLGYKYGLVESKAISIDETWSGLKFTHPKKGKEYHNSYGELHLDKPTTTKGEQAMDQLNIRVHQAKEDELPIVQDILMQTAGWLKSIGSKQWNGILEGKDHHDTPAAIQRGEVYLATVQDKPAGMFVLWDRQSEWDRELWGMDESLDYMYLHRVNIVREFAGQGVASELLAASLEIAKSKGKKAVRLDCLAANDYLNKFYAGAGFKQVGVVKEHDAGEQTADFNLYEQAV